MTTETVENLADDTLYADDPDGPEDDFGGEPAGHDGGTEAPYGWTIDKETGQPRPKKAPGRPRAPKTAEELAAGPTVEHAADEAPARKPPRDRPPAKPDPAPDGDEPMPAGGTIAKGVNKLYRQAGRILRARDHDLGQALIDVTRPDPEDPDALTVGQAWENLAKVNLRIRKFVLNLLKGGAWRDLAMAHAPILLALAMKEWVQKIIPFGRLLESWLEPDEDTPEDGLRPADAQQMHDMAQAQAQRAMRRMGVKLPPEQVASMVAEAERRAAGASGPRSQPRHRSRAARKGHAR